LSKKPYVGIDGIQRPQDVDERISLDVAAMLATPTGQSVMQYLKSITTDIANGPNISNDELRHLEGQRFVIGLLSSRTNHANTIKSKEGKNE
jgi:hypothetical protein|tara:strand:+ start:304 stop:579 length:276 start_codon:yes stop_codon:yes gene_type:complete